MTKKDYILIAGIARSRYLASDLIERDFVLAFARELALALKRDNPAFDQDQFVQAIEKG